MGFFTQQLSISVWQLVLALIAGDILYGITKAILKKAFRKKSLCGISSRSSCFSGK
jgi:hypothetical protein